MRREVCRGTPPARSSSSAAALEGFTVLDRACRTAGVAGLVPNDLRRSAVRNLERAGVPRATAMKLVGHKTEAIYRRYAIVVESDLLAGGEKLDGLH